MLKIFMYMLYLNFALIPALFAEIPQPALNTFPPMIEIYHPVSTTSREAQKSFDRGLAYLFAYNHDMSFASFEKAAQLDSNLGMAYWGMAIARGQNVNEDVTPENEIKCYNYIQKALKLSDNASQNEKDYISAAVKRYTNDPSADLIPLRFTYREAMKRVVSAYPEDLDAATLYAESILQLDPWKWWTPQGKPKDGVMEALEKLDFVLSRNPLHIGANHFYIHAWEESPTPQRALMSANRLGSLFPESGHLMHMPCHIFLLVGDYEHAVDNSKKAIALDSAYFQEHGLTMGTYPTHYLSHNLYVFSHVYMLMEDYENAIQIAIKTSNFVEPYLEIMPHLERYAISPLEIYLYFHKWDKILKYQTRVKTPMAQAYWHFSRAKAYASLGDLDLAQKEKELLLQHKQQIPNVEEYANNPARKIVELAELDLEATLAAVQENYSEQIELLKKAVVLQDQLNYDEPPSWYTPLRISLGAALIKQQNFTESEKAFFQASRELQRNGRILFGLSLSLKGENRLIEAYWVEREMTDALKYASRSLELDDL